MLWICHSLLATGPHKIVPLFKLIIILKWLYLIYNVSSIKKNLCNFQFTEISYFIQNLVTASLSSCPISLWFGYYTYHYIFILARLLAMVKMQKYKFHYMPIQMTSHFHNLEVLEHLSIKSVLYFIHWY